MKEATWNDIEKSELSEKEKTKLKALLQLKKLLPPGTVVYTILRHLSRSGMTRVVDMVFVHRELNEICRVPPRPLEELDFPYKWERKHEGWKVEGWGFDAGFELVYMLSKLLYGDVDKLKHRWL